MTTIINIPWNEDVKDSRPNINTNFTNLNTDKAETSGQVFTWAVSATNLSWTNTWDQDISNLVTWPASSTDNAIARFDSTTGKIIQNWIVTQDDTWNLGNVDWIDMDLTPTSDSHTPWRLRYNASENTLDFDTELGNSIQIWQETWVTFFNDTWITIPNGTVVRAIWFNGWRTVDDVELVQSDVIDNISGQLFITTTEALNWAEWAMTIFGKVRWINTSTFSLNDTLYVSSTVAWWFTNVKPIFPNYAIAMWIVLEVWVSGSIWVNQITFVNDTFHDQNDGSFRESLNFLVTSNGTVVTGTLTSSDALAWLTMVFSSWLQTLDVSTPPTITLTSGTSSNPQSNYVYIPISTKVLTVSTTEFPATEHIKVAFIVLRDAVTTQADDALRNTNWNDHVKTVWDNGHLLHIAERIRTLPAKWDSWVAWSSVVVGASDVDIATTSWKVYQLHLQTFLWLDTSTWDDLHMVNDFTSPYKTVTNLGLETDDALWNGLANSSFSVVLWWVQNKTWEKSHMMINLPIWSYAKNSPEDAVADASNFSVYDIPTQFEWAWFLIARFTYQLEPNGTTWTLHDTQDLRGKIPNTTAWGGWWGAWVTEWTQLTDTPSSYISQGLKLTRVNVWETAQEFVTADKTLVWLANVDNTSDATKNSATVTLTNKRITERVNTIASSATPTPAWDTTDEFTVTALAVNATFAAPTGTPTEWQVLLIRIKDNATARTLAWNAIYRASSDLALPTTTIISKTLYLQFVYNSDSSTWDLLGLLNNL